MARTLAFSQLVDDRPAHRATRALGPVDRAFTGILRDAQDARVPRVHRLKFRPSNARPCQWAVMLSGLVPAHEQDDFAQDFYKAVGLTAHEVVQRWLGRTGVLFGDFVCRCGQVVRSQGHPDGCPAGCRKPDWRYRELDLVAHDPSGELSSAKIDGLVRWPSMAPDHYYLIDIKTCSLASLPRPDVGFTRDYHVAYLDQTAVYRVLCDRAGFTIDGTVFVMVPRDNPRRTIAIPVEQPDYRATFDVLVARWRAARQAGETGDLRAITRDCQGRLDRQECPYHGVCWDDRATDKLFIQQIGRPPVRA